MLHSIQRYSFNCFLWNTIWMGFHSCNGEGRRDDAKKTKKSFETNTKWQLGWPSSYFCLESRQPGLNLHFVRGQLLRKPIVQSVFPIWLRLSVPFLFIRDLRCHSERTPLRGNADICPNIMYSGFSLKPHFLCPLRAISVSRFSQPTLGKADLQKEA